MADYVIPALVILGIIVLGVILYLLRKASRMYSFDLQCPVPVGRICVCCISDQPALKHQETTDSLLIPPEQNGTTLQSEEKSPKGDNTPLEQPNANDMETPLTNNTCPSPVDDPPDKVSSPPFIDDPEDEQQNENNKNAYQYTGEDFRSGEPGMVKMIDTFDRPGKAFTAGTYSGSGTYAEAFENEPMKRIPKAGVYAGTGVGLARAEWSVFDAEAKGPNASAGAGASLASLSAAAFAKAGVGSASTSVGPVKATVGLAADTGIGISPSHVEAKIVGTGVSIGRKMGISVLGSGIEVNLW